MNIRNAIKDDAASIAKAHIEAWCSGYKGIMPDEYLNSLSVELRTKEWQEALTKSSPGINLVVEYNNVVSGFCVYGPARDKDISSPNVGELVALNILPNAWGMGLGSELVKHVIESATKKKWKLLYLWVIKENTRARKLYESMGFEVEGNEKVDTELTGCKLQEIRYVKKLG